MARRETPDEETLRRKELELQPAVTAELHSLAPELLSPGQLVGLWPNQQGPLSYPSALLLFDGSHAPRLASPQVLEDAVRAAVLQGLVMADIADIRLFREPLPGGALAKKLSLYAPPAPLTSADLLPQALPDVWQNGEATLFVVAQALQARRGYPLPWMLLMGAVDQALGLGVLEVMAGVWPCSPVTMDTVRLRQPVTVIVTPDMLVTALSYTGSKTPTVQALKDAVEGRLLGGRSVSADQFLTTAKQAIASGKLKLLDTTSSDGWLRRVRLPDAALYGEIVLSPLGLQRISEKVEELVSVAPGLVFKFHMALSAEGETPDEATLDRLNAILDEIEPGWKLG